MAVQQQTVENPVSFALFGICMFAGFFYSAWKLDRLKKAGKVSSKDRIGCLYGLGVVPLMILGGMVSITIWLCPVSAACGFACGYVGGYYGNLGLYAWLRPDKWNEGNGN